MEREISRNLVQEILYLLKLLASGFIFVKKHFSLDLYSKFYQIVELLEITVEVPFEFSCEKAK